MASHLVAGGVGSGPVGASLRLLQASHLSQQGRLSAPGLGPLAQQSFLGGLLPESLLYVLTTQGPEAFAAAMVGDVDNPELIWTHRMRGQRLVPQARAFPAVPGPLRSLAVCPSRISWNDAWNCVNPFAVPWAVSLSGLSECKPCASYLFMTGTRVNWNIGVYCRCW